MATNSYSSILKIHKGFSLIEVIITLAILATLFSVVVGILDPITQFKKAADARREHDLTQVQSSLDSYHNDQKCYPSGISFGVSWVANGSIYIKKVPEDPECTADPNHCYIYQTDTTVTCPQWNVLYAKLRAPITGTNRIFCPLESLTNCLPPNYASLGYNFCLTSGKVDCDYIANHNLVRTSFGPTATPTPPGCSLNYACTGGTGGGRGGPGSKCNVILPANTGDYCESNCRGECPGDH